MSMAAASSALAPSRSQLVPIIEIFGPTIQGEGAEAGLVTHFVRVGGCDYRCAWCDTMYAVDPEIVRTTAEKMSAEDIVGRVCALDGQPVWTTISGGNPALHELGDVVEGLHDAGYRVSVETQGSVWKSWLADVDRLTISPKPPSSGMATAPHAAQFDRFMSAVLDGRPDRSVLKIVVFDEEDLVWAMDISKRCAQLPLYLSAGTAMPAGHDVREAVGERYRWLCERVATIPVLRKARVLPQLHVIAWKAATGV
jgi:7-carboxy-7-deazaguanine synthase